MMEEDDEGGGRREGWRVGGLWARPRSRARHSHTMQRWVGWWVGMRVATRDAHTR
jgi:hypothetical protein